MSECNKSILRTLELARQLTILADEGEATADDDSCLVLYGIVRDCAYKIRHAAEHEKENHKLKGTWESGLSLKEHR